MRWPADPRLHSIAAGTVEARQPHRDRAEQRGDPAGPVIFDPACAAADPARRSVGRVSPALSGDDRLLDPGQELLALRMRQTEIRQIAQIPGTLDLQHIDAARRTLDPALHQAQYPAHSRSPAGETPGQSYLARHGTPNFSTVPCDEAEAGIGWPSHCRSTPELDQIRARYSALLPYRVAAGVLEHLLPIGAGITHETLRAHTLKRGAELRDAAPAEPAVAAAAVTLSVDSTSIRSCEDGQRHLEVRLGNVETATGARQVFAAVARTDTRIETLIRRRLQEVGHTPDTALTAFTDGCPGLRSILAEAGVAEPPFLDWFHIALRLEHAEKTAGSLPSDTPEQERAKAAIVQEVRSEERRV